MRAEKKTDEQIATYFRFTSTVPSWGTKQIYQIAELCFDMNPVSFTVTIPTREEEKEEVNMV